MISKQDSNKARLQRHKRIRGKISGCAERPRLCVFKSSKHIYAQIIDDVTGNTLVACSTVEKVFADIYGGNKDAAKKIGEELAKRALNAGIKDVVFDRGGYLYHGRIKELAEGAREGGLNF